MIEVGCDCHKKQSEAGIQDVVPALQIAQNVIEVLRIAALCQLVCQNHMLKHFNVQNPTGWRNVW